LVVVTDSNPSSSFQLAIGEELILRLPENPTTGYVWRFTQSGTGALRQVDDRYVAKAEPSGPAPGAGGHHQATFIGEKKGGLQLEATEGREWESSDQSVQRRVYTIVVR